MTAEENFMERISRSLGRAAPPETVPEFTWRRADPKDVLADRSRDDLTAIFIERSKENGISVFETTRAGLNGAIGKAVGEFGPGSVVIANDPLLNELDTASILASKHEIHIWNNGGSRKENIRFAEKASAGIAVSKMALAESATVLLFSYDGCGRSVSLLPDSVVYIVPGSSIYPRLTQGMEFLRRNREDLPASVNFVSGPSATSDIELVRVVGVHGPIKVAHIVVHDI